MALDVFPDSLLPGEAGIGAAGGWFGPIGVRLCGASVAALRFSGWLTPACQTSGLFVPARQKSPTKGGFFVWLARPRGFEPLAFSVGG